MHSPLGSVSGFSIRNWAAWAPGLETHAAWLDWSQSPTLPHGDTSPAAGCLPSMLRRRTQRLGRMALESLFAIVPDTPPETPVVFASRHGETQRSLTLIHELQKEGNVSPQSFSLSVHNATAGLYTIARTCHANVTALAGGNATGAALLSEAFSLLTDGAPSVLVVACDELLPDCYAPYADEPQAAFAWAAELTAGTSFVPATQVETAAAHELPELLTLLHFLLDEHQSAWRGGHGHAGWLRRV